MGSIPTQSTNEYLSANTQTINAIYCEKSTLLL